MSITIEHEWAGWFQGGTSDKVWAACYTSNGRYLAVWGRRGATYQSQAKDLGYGGAWARYDAKVREKTREGYIPVPFNDPRYGSIPSFVLGRESSGAKGALTVASVLARARVLITEAARSRSDEALARGLMEWKQLTTLLELFLTVPTITPDERAALQAAGHTLHGQVLDRLFA